ncbi:MAG: cobalamin-independent methionine synthase II family protein [Deltaproteobacteria bacterium]|nr:cobalamin-independent methionine synthase II family protein [Deltaproteobacteria bacterium]
MKRSTDRILTTHTGSLPRPDDLLSMLQHKESGEAFDPAALATRVKSAVAETVRQQMNAGIDIVNDGEMGKPSYSTYVKDRMSGFEGSERSTSLRATDLAEFRNFARRGANETGVAVLKRPACSGPIAYRDRNAVEIDVQNLQAAVAAARPVEAFMTAASPGVITFFLTNKYYPKHEAYLQALAEAMRTEYEAISAAGLILQVDCPDLAMSRHVQFKDLNLADFRKTIELHIDVLNHALVNVPADRVRLHLCWGNYEGPHHHDVALRDILDIVLKARVGAISYEASNPRHEHEWAVFKDLRIPEGMILIPGVIDSVTNFIEHPELVAQRICNVARQVGRENVIAGTDCGFATIAGSSRVDGEIAWAKFKAMAEGAQLASRELWRT